MRASLGACPHLPQPSGTAHWNHHLRPVVGSEVVGMVSQGICTVTPFYILWKWERGFCKEPLRHYAGPCCLWRGPSVRQSGARLAPEMLGRR
jgi:hypothetical protein